MYKIKLLSKSNSRLFVNVEVLATDVVSATTFQAPCFDPEIPQYAENKGWRLDDA